MASIPMSSLRVIALIAVVQVILAGCVIPGIPEAQGPSRVVFAAFEETRENGSLVTGVLEVRADGTVAGGVVTCVPDAEPDGAPALGRESLLSLASRTGGRSPTPCEGGRVPVVARAFTRTWNATETLEFLRIVRDTGVADVAKVGEPPAPPAPGARYVVTGSEGIRTLTVRGNVTDPEAVAARVRDLVRVTITSDGAPFVRVENT